MQQKKKKKRKLFHRPQWTQTSLHFLSAHESSCVELWHELAVSHTDDKIKRSHSLPSSDGSLEGLPFCLELQHFRKIEKYAQAHRCIHILHRPVFGFLIHSSTGSSTPISSVVITLRTEYLFTGTKLSVVVCLT